MIGFLVGAVIHREDTQITLLVSGVGYEINCTLNALSKVNEKAKVDASGGGNAELWVHMVVREDAQLLYGFADQTERSLFRELIRISGIGPKVALAILSGMDSPGLVKAIKNADSAMLTKIPGIGKKTAERLVVEMKDRLDGWGVELDNIGSDQAPASGCSDLRSEAESALAALGYKPAEASRMVESLELTDADSAETLIRRALRNKLS